MEKPYLFDPVIHTHLIPSLVSVHATCITSRPYTIATFLPPLNNSKMTSWWEDRVKEVANRTRHLIMQLATNVETGKEEVVGYVMLDMPFAETGPFRGVVEKLLVSPAWRKKGIARALMKKLEEVAQKEGRSLLTLETEKGSPAEFVYPRLDYVKIGEIPGHQISPLDGTLKDAVCFYKDIRTKGSASQPILEV